MPLRGAWPMGGGSGTGLAVHYGGCSSPQGLPQAAEVTVRARPRGPRAAFREAWVFRCIWLLRDPSQAQACLSSLVF